MSSTPAIADSTLFLADLRKTYTLAGLRRSDLDPDPLQQFKKWLQEALNSGVPEPNAMTLATADRHGCPSARTVLLKGLDERGFTFFTNYQSRKSRELAENPNAALVFFWGAVERQVCVAGTLSRVSRDESETYFKVRPRGHKLGAWVSNQGEVIASRTVLEDRLQEVALLYPNDDIPLPPYWGGFVLAPIRIDFWQGRTNRLHDRFQYSMTQDRLWRIDRLAP